MPYTFEKIAVIGAGTMGQGIARACAAAGFITYLVDQNDNLAHEGVQTIRHGLDNDARKGKLSAAEAKATGERIHVSSNGNWSAQLIIEAIVEDLAVKKKLFLNLETLRDPGIENSPVVITSNTSSLSISDLATGLKRPEQFAGIHFFNPAHIMKLVEVIAGKATEPMLIDALVEFVKKLGKTPVVAKDSPGFIVNRVARHYYLESLRLLEQEISNPESIDRLLRSAGFKMGPFELMDLIGIDINFNVTQSVYRAFGEDPKFKPSAIQESKIKAGTLGRKSGKGFYDYEKI